MWILGEIILTLLLLFALIDLLAFGWLPEDEAHFPVLVEKS